MNNNKIERINIVNSLYRKYRISKIFNFNKIKLNDSFGIIESFKILDNILDKSEVKIIDTVSIKPVDSNTITYIYGVKNKAYFEYTLYKKNTTIVIVVSDKIWNNISSKIILKKRGLKISLIKDIFICHLKYTFSLNIDKVFSKKF